MDKFVHYKESNTPCVLDRSHGLNEIAGFEVQNRRRKSRYRFGQAVNRLDRSTLMMIAGLFLSVSAFSQTPGGPAGPYLTSEQPIQTPARQDKTPVDPQVNLIMDRMSVAQVFYLSNIEEPSQTHSLYSNFAGSPESVFRVEDGKLPGPSGSIPIRLYSPDAQTGLPRWVFFHGGGLVAGGLDMYEAPLRAVTSRCDCPFVSVGYGLAPENRYPAASQDAFAATKWVAERSARIAQNPRTPLSATPRGTFGLPPTPGAPQTPTSEAYRAGGNIDLTALASHFRMGLWFRQQN